MEVSHFLLGRLAKDESPTAEMSASAAITHSANSSARIRQGRSNGPKVLAIAIIAVPAQNFCVLGRDKTEDCGLLIGDQGEVRLLGDYSTSMTEIRANRTNCRTGMS